MNVTVSIQCIASMSRDDVGLFEELKSRTRTNARLISYFNLNTGVFIIDSKPRSISAISWTSPLARSLSKTLRPMMPLYTSTRMFCRSRQGSSRSASVRGGKPHSRRRGFMGSRGKKLIEAYVEPDTVCRFSAGPQGNDQSKQRRAQVLVPGSRAIFDSEPPKQRRTVRFDSGRVSRPTRQNRERTQGAIGQYSPEKDHHINDIKDHINASNCKVKKHRP